MKKFLTFLCTVACVLSLTACGEATTYTEYEQSKLEYAESAVLYNYLPLMDTLTSDLSINLDEYTAEEIESFTMDENGIKTVDGNGLKSAAISFRSSAETVGGIQEVGDITSRIDGDNIIVNVKLIGENKNADAEFVLSNDIFCVMQAAALNPEATTGDKMVKATLNTVIGMGTVFIVLILISFLISLFRFIPGIVEGVTNIFNKKEKVDENKESIDNTIQQIVEKEENNSNLASDLELVAVISAAIAAYEGEAGADGFVVRSIRKVNRRA